MKKSIKKLPRNISTIIIFYLAWIIITGKLEISSLLLGIPVACLPVIIFPEVFSNIISPNIYKRFVFVIAFLFYLLLEVLVASYKIAYFSLFSPVALKSYIWAYDYELDDHAGIFFLTTVITLTPGTLVVDINIDQKRIYIHSISHIKGDKQEHFATIQLMENWLRRIFE